MKSEIDQGIEIFKNEAYELLAELEAALLELEERSYDAEIINQVFRAMHTIKGSAAMFGYDDITALAHELENAFDLVRGNKLSVSKELIDLTLSARDSIFEMLDSGTTANQLHGHYREIIASIRELMPAGDSGKEISSATRGADRKDTSCEKKQKDKTFWIRFCPDRDILQNGTNPIALIRELSKLGTCKVIAHVGEIPLLNEIDPVACNTFWDIILTTNKGKDAIKDVFIFVEDRGSLNIKIIDESGTTDHKRVGDILIENGDLTIDDLMKALRKQKKIGEVLVEDGVIDHRKVQSALLEQQYLQDIQVKRDAEKEIMNVRVASDKLDSLVDLVGEMVTVQARLSEYSDRQALPELNAIAEEVERLIEDLRDRTMSIRMLPIGATFSKFRRLVRDLSRDLGKEVIMTTEGGETELDKTVIERLNDPLVHLIRNCIYHGIEAPEAREAIGKPKRGAVHLSAEHSGAHVLIHVTDDGAGIDLTVVRQKALEKGMIGPDMELTEKEIVHLILAPGFSTEDRVTDISGRGVGMDVLKKGIESLRGDIEIKTRQGEGTTITLKLPLTLAIVDGLLVRIGDGFYVIPLSAVEECVELLTEDITNAHGRNLADVRGEVVPYVRLREQFTVTEERPAVEQIVITNTDGTKVGFVVDYVIGEHQTVIKSLGRAFKNVDGVSGATILGNGTVALILDIQKLIHAAETRAGSINGNSHVINNQGERK